MTKAYLMNSLIEKMQSPDQDFRFMGLNDLMTEIKADPTNFQGDDNMEDKVLKQVLSLVEDKISEVKNQAVKCLGQLIKLLREPQMEFVVDKLIGFSTSNDDELRDISNLALKTITSELPQDGKVAPKACAKLTPKLLETLKNSSSPPETLIETLSVFSILVTRFPVIISSQTLASPPIAVISPLLSHSRPAVRKRAILTLAQFLPTSPPELFAKLLNGDLLPALQPNASLENQRTTVQLIAAVARHAPQHIAPYLSSVVPGVVTAASRDDDELREVTLQALEALVLRCPSEITPYLAPIVQVGTKFIKYDPNYAGDDDDEDEDMADEDDDDADLDDEYSDDEDTSYKIRRSATKLLAAIIGTRPELLTLLYKEVSPVLISRFGDREETVKLEVWTTYNGLLGQTRVYSLVAQSNGDASLGVKRKREDDDDKPSMDVEGSPSGFLQAQLPSLAKVLLHQIKSPKTSSAALQAAFGLLQSVLTVLPGSLAAQTPQIFGIAQSVLSQSPTTTTSTLHTTILSFLVLFFSTHAPSTFTSPLSSIIPALLKSLGERHPRVASETFRVFSALLDATKPIKGAEWIDTVYVDTTKRLRSPDTDAEVRSCAEACMGDLWICATDVTRAKDGKEWEAICRTSGNTEGAVKVVTRVGKEVDMSNAWINYSVEWLVGLLKKSGRSGKIEVFIALDVLLRSYSAVPPDLATQLVPQLHHFITTSDIPLLAQALLILSVLLRSAPSDTFPEVEQQILRDVYPIAASPLVSGASLDAILAFFDALVVADTQIANHVVPDLVIRVEKLPPADVSQANVAKCVAQVVKSQQGVAAGVIAEFSKSIKNGSKATPTRVVLSLLILGEVGRFIDMAPQSDIFNQIVEYFKAEREDARTAAAFAVGNIAIGNLHQFLPSIVKMVQADAGRRLLSLHAIKEVVTHCSHGQLEGVAEVIWVPLFENSENSEDATRNVAAACLGKLTTTNPSRYLPQLQARVKDANPATRATVVSAIRYTFVDTSQSYDELLAPIIVDFLSLMLDEDLNVRRLALSALNAAARNKPNLIRDHLPTLLPTLYQETKMKPELVRVVQMGPWQHKVDDGLETRKTAYETMYTLLDTCLNKLDLHELLERVLVGLSDDSDEVKVICHMMLFRLSQVAPTAVVQRLDDITPLLEKTMKGPNVTKDTVKQDLERTAELQRSTLRAVSALTKITTTGSSTKFDTLYSDLTKSQWSQELKELTGA